MASKAEMAEKQRRVRMLLERNGGDALLLARSDNFAWFTCGGDCHVNSAQEAGVGAVLIHPDRKTLITNNVERPRLLDEELAGQGFAEEISLWAEDGLGPALARVAPGERILSDTPMSGVIDAAGEIAAIRRSLTAEEVDRYRALGADVGAAMADACGDVQPGMAEHEAAAAVARHHFRRGIKPIVVLVAADERLMKYRHPLPTANPVKKTIMLVVCGRRQGLIVSATRLVSFGAIGDDLRRKHEAVVRVDAAFIAATRVGARIGDVFSAGLAAYAEQGHPDEWKLHHQGGPTGYAPRDYRAVASTDDTVQENQAFAWNPSITGTKSEDTIIAMPGGPEIISASPGFPKIEVVSGGMKLERPDILVR